MKISAAVTLSALLVLEVSRSAAQSPTLDTVRVAARSSPSLALTRSTEVIGREELEKRAGHDLADILSTSIGIDVFRRSPAQADLSIRGSSFNQIVLLVDGVRVSDAQSGHYNLDLAVPVEAIERIEILRGGGSVMYGADAIGGVVNIVTRRKAEDAAAVAAHGGTFGTAAADLALASVARGTALRLTADARHSDGHRDGTDYRTVQSRLAATRPIRNGTFGLDAGVGIRNFGAADFYGAFPSYEDTRAVTGTGSFGWAFDNGWRLDASADLRRHYDLFTLDRANPTAYQNRHLSWQHGARVTATGRIDRVQTVVGTEALDVTLQSVRLGDHDEQRRAAFTELSMGSASRILGMIGSRVDWSSRTGTFFSPGASIVTAVTPRLRLRASANRGFRAPTWTETFYTDPANVANPDLRSETFDMGEVGARATPDWGSLDLAVFVRKGNELIDWTKPASTPTAQWRSTNLESATFRGVEMETGIADLAGLEWKLRASGIHITSYDADTLIGKYALSPITESGSVEAMTPAIFGARLTINSGRARRARESAYWRTDLRITRPIRGWTLRLDGLNLSDANYRDASAKPVAGRMLLVGLGR